MKGKLLTLLIGVSVISALVAVPLMTACAPEGAPEAPEVPEAPAAPAEPATPVEPAAPKTVKVGFLAALTGEAAGWGLPGLYGCEIWVDEVNAVGGLQIGDDKYLIEIVSYDDEYMATKAVLGAKKLVMEDDVAIVLMLDSPPVHAAAPWLAEQKMIQTTLNPFNLRPEYPYLMATSENCLFFCLTIYDYVARMNPEAKTVAMCNPDDESRRFTMEFARAAWESAGIEVVYDKFYDPMTVDFAPIATAMIATGADIMCWEASYSYGVHLLTEQAMLQGFEGILCAETCDMYPELIERVGKEYL
ncbi:ABC transporter substrate-binding protein, partial [Chloroflexota bacterium]